MKFLGIQYNEVQAEVNKRESAKVKPKPKSTSKSISKVVDGVTAGDWGNGLARFDRSRKAGSIRT